MQTVYYTTTNFIRHEGNLVDLCEFRRKLSLSQQEQAHAHQAVSQISSPRKAPLTLLPTGKGRCFALGKWALWVLDLCASLGVIVMTCSFALKFFL